MKKYTLYIVCLVMGLLFISGNAFAQSSITVKGVVKNSAGEPLIGSLVTVEGSNTASVTDKDGKYSITFGKASKLVFSSLSYITQTVEVEASTTLDIVLSEDTQQIDDVVVIGYGAVSKSDLTGAVTSVKIDEDRAMQTSSIDQLLQGQAAGVQVVSNSAAPDGGVSVTIRGSSSFNSSSEPLYVVDGIIMNTTGSFSVGSHGGTDSGVDEENNGLMGINPADIASMEVLKDASATAIYGSQGANGVILITTKSASKEKPVITFSGGVSVSHIYKKFDLMNADDYIQYLDLKGVDHLDASYTAFTNGVANGTYAPVDWQDFSTRTSITQRYYLTIAGRPNKTDYRFSIGYYDNEGIMKGTGYENLTLRLNLDRTLGKVKVGTRTSFSHLHSVMTQGAGSTIAQTPSTSMVLSMLMTRPLRHIVEYDDEGTAVNDEGVPMPSPDTWLTDYQSERTEMRVIPSLYAEYKILPWLTFKTTLGADFRTNERLKFKSTRINTQATGSNGAISHVELLNLNWDNVLTFRKKFKKHSISGTLGQSASQGITRTQSVEGTNITQWRGMSSTLNEAPYTWFGYGEAYSRLMSFFARAIYNYDERYILTATYRFDGSSRFAGANKWAQFPSLAFAWRMSEERWFRVPLISSVKVRLGWGKVGNQGIPSYQTIKRYSAGSVSTHDNATQKLTKVTSYNIPSKELNWETTEQYNAGVDMSFFYGRLNLSADVYYKKTNDLLQTRILPGSAGISNPYVNMGAIANKGFELSLDGVIFDNKNFGWSVGANFTLNRNEILSIDPNGTSRAKMFVYKGEEAREVDYFTGSSLSTAAIGKDYINIFIAGEPMCLFYALPTDGLVGEGQTGVPLVDGEVRGEGAVNFIDTNKDGVITVEDKVVVGNPNPDFTYGFNTKFDYKNFSLSAQFIGSYGNDVYNQQKAVLSDLSTKTENRLRAAVFDAWTPQNPDASFPSVSAYRIGDMSSCSDRFVEDGSYLRLANLSLSYNFKIKSKKSILRNINVGVSGKNLYCWTNYSGYDPDVNIYGSVLRYGVDVGAYPAARTYMFDLKLTF
jgi:TonB-linked SusC/RagA family outer membrane protein